MAIVKKQNNYYNKVLKARRNLTDNKNVFQFKNKKWQRFVFFAKKKLKFFKRYKLSDPLKIRVIKFASQGNSFKKSFRNYLSRAVALKLVYGDFKKKKFKNYFVSRNKGPDSSHLAFHKLETSLTAVLYRSKFSCSIKQAKQMVLHGHVFVNDGKETNCYSQVGSKDIISLSNNPKIREMVKINLLQTRFWPLPNANFKINYSTLEIINIASEKNNKSFSLNSHLSVDRLRNNARFK